MGELFPAIVYVLCLLTSAACAWLLGRGYRESRSPLLLWSSVCFGFLAANNLALIADLLVYPSLDLRIVRLAFALAAVMSLIWAFIWQCGEE